MNNFYEKIKNGVDPYIIAEIGANHNGDMELAKQMILTAKECGCDCAKFQSWTPASLICQSEYDRNQSYNDSPKKHFGSLREMVEKYYLRPEQHRELSEYCRKMGVTFNSTPFSNEEVDLLDALDVPFFKIASMDVTNHQLLDYVARKGRSIVFSTGMATLAEIAQAVEVMERAGNRSIILLHCVALYPPIDTDIHLRNMEMLKNTFGYPIGFSDHTFSAAVPLAAVALGAKIVEKHFTTDKDLPGWDHDISADPAQMKQIVSGARQIVKALGSYTRQVSAAEIEKRKKFRRSVVAARHLKPGERLAVADVVFKRPGTGIGPEQVDNIIGRQIKRPVAKDAMLVWEDLN